MNLYYLLEKNSRHLETSEGVTHDRRQIDGENIFGARLPKGQKSNLRFLGASEHAHIKCGLDDVGFCGMATGLPGLAKSGDIVTVSFVSGENRVERRTVVYSEALTPLLLPNALDLDDPFAVADLVIETNNPSSDIFISTNGRTPRDALYRLAKGVGVEIGPGPKPQIKNGPDTSVIYIEEKPADEWLATYKTEATDIAWSAQNYKIGKAHDLPVDDHSLDFIFSSHVIEHLYNPLGHFDHWRRKLKPGGLVLGVIPSSDGTKDFIQPQTQITELIEEYRAGGFDIPLITYEKWVGAHQQRDATGDELARRHFDTKFSIHVHVYDYMSVTALLRHCVKAHGYSDFRIHYKRNSKDFVFALKADTAH